MPHPQTQNEHAAATDMASPQDSRAFVLRYIRAEKSAYNAFENEITDEAKAGLRLGRRANWLRRTHKLANFLEEQNLTVPASFFQPYGVPVADRVASGIPLKYQFRAYNILRDYARLSQSAPELLAPDARPVSVLDPSSGGCGVYEALQHVNHDVTCTDYYEPGDNLRFGKVYRKIHEDIGLDVAHFNGQARPYAYADGAFDYVICFQALDAYAHEDRWVEPVRELLRIASTAVILVFNPPARNKAGLTDAIYRMLLQLEAETLRVSSFQCPDTNLPGIRLSKGSEQSMV